MVCTLGSFHYIRVGDIMRGGSMLEMVIIGVFSCVVIAVVISAGK